jgi:hypothetical protein
VGAGGGRAEVGRAEVVVADQLELAVFGLVRIHAPIAGRRYFDRRARGRARPLFRLSRLVDGDVLVFLG